MLRRAADGCISPGQFRIDRKVGETLRIFDQLFGCFALVIKCCVVLQRGKCGCFVLIKNYLQSIRLYGQSGSHFIAYSIGNFLSLQKRRSTAGVQWVDTMPWPNKNLRLGQLVHLVRTTYLPIEKGMSPHNMSILCSLA